MPHLETKLEVLQGVERLVFKIRPDPPREEWRPVKMVLPITRREDVRMGDRGADSRACAYVPSFSTMCASGTIMGR